MPLFHDPALTHRIIGLAMRVDARLGPGLLASVYERCLCHEFDRDGLPYARQVDLTLDYDGTLIACGYRADLIIRDGVLLELKSVERVLPLHKAQLQTYLRLSGCRVGLLLNFNVIPIRDGLRKRVWCLLVFYRLAGLCGGINGLFRARGYGAIKQTRSYAEFARSFTESCASLCARRFGFRREHANSIAPQARRAERAFRGTPCKIRVTPCQLD